MAKFVDVRMNPNLGGLYEYSRRVRKAINDLPKQATDHFRSITPIRTGNARKNTKLENSKTIHANYAYAQRLDTGWSKQAPNGMTKPTEEWIKQQFRKLRPRKNK